MLIHYVRYVTEASYKMENYRGNGYSIHHIFHLSFGAEIMKIFLCNVRFILKLIVSLSLRRISPMVFGRMKAKGMNSHCDVMSFRFPSSPFQLGFVSNHCKHLIIFSPSLRSALLPDVRDRLRDSSGAGRGNNLPTQQRSLSP